MAHKKGAGSTKNGRDSNAKRLGVKRFGGEKVRAGNILIGKPYLKSVKIKGKILEHLRGKKTIVYKMRPKKKTRKKQGHRQELTRVLIEDIIVS